MLEEYGTVPGTCAYHGSTVPGSPLFHFFNWGMRAAVELESQPTGVLPAKNSLMSSLFQPIEILPR